MGVAARYARLSARPAALRSRRKKASRKKLSHGSSPVLAMTFSALQPGPELLLLLATWLARRLGLGLRASDVGRHLAHEFLKVAQALQPVGDYRVIDLDVVMHEYVTEPDSLADRDGQLSCEDSVLSEQPDGVTVVGRRRQPSVAQMCCATSTQASMAVTKVYFTPRSQMGS
jgi:hypothetical protein